MELVRFNQLLLDIEDAADDLDASVWMRHAFLRIRREIPFDYAWWGSGCPVEGSTDVVHHYMDTIDLPDGFIQDFLNQGLDNPYARLVRGTLDVGHRINGRDHIDSEKPEFLRVYNLFHGLTVCSGDQFSGLLFVKVLYRGIDKEPFTEDEEHVFAFLVQHLIRHWRRQMKIALSKGTANMANAAIANMKGELLYASTFISDTLHSTWPEWDGGLLPKRLIVAIERGEREVACATGTFELTSNGRAVTVLFNERHQQVLSPQERRVAQLFAAGMSYKEVARDLQLTPATVRTYLRNAYERLGVSNKILLSHALKPDIER